METRLTLEQVYIVLDLADALSANNAISVSDALKALSVLMSTDWTVDI